MGRILTMARFINHYECPRCGNVWTDAWDCMVDDDCPECGLRHISPAESEDEDQIAPLSGLAEVVILADGPARQQLAPGIAPVPFLKRQLAQEAKRRAARRGDAPLPAGGLFDDVARAQTDLFS
jgi:predicted  nucleic acid-binding Zn-ribbon protein